MNKFLLLVCLGLLGFIVWREKAAISEWKEKTGTRLERFVFRDNLNAEDEPDTTPGDPPPAPGAPAEAAPKRPPAPVNPVKLPEPPEGVFYLRERITVKLDGGVRGYAAGTRVTKTGENQGLVTVTDGINPFSVEADKLTRDMALVQEIHRRAADAAAKPPSNRTPSP